MDQYPDGTIADGPNGPIIFQGGQWQPMAGPPQGRPTPRVIPIPQSPQRARDNQRQDANLDINQQSEARNATNTKFDNERALRADFAKSNPVATYRTIIRQYATGIKAQKTPAGDQALINSYAQMLNPTSTVMLGEYEATSQVDSTANQIKTRLQKEFGWDGAGRISQNARVQLLNEMYSIAANANQSYNQERQHYSDLAKRNGFDPESIIGPHVGEPFYQEIDKALKSEPGAHVQGASITDGGVNAPASAGTPPPESFADSYLSQGMSGVNEGIANTLGAPVDLTTALMNLVPKGINAVANTNLPQISNPVGGGQWMRDKILAPTIGGQSSDPSKQFTRRVGQSVGGAIVPGMAFAKTPGQFGSAMAGGFGGGVGGATAQQAFPGNIGAEMAGEMAGGGLGLAGGMGAMRRNARRGVEAAIPTVDQLKQQAGDLYRQAEARGVTASPMQTQELADNLRAALRRDGRVSPTGRISEVYPKVREAMQLADDYAGSPMSPTQMQTVRKVAADGLTSPDASERRIGGMMMDTFDEWANPLAPELPQARDIASRYLNAEKLGTARDLAGAQASQFTGSGFENALRTQYRALDRNAIKGKDRFSADLMNAIENVSRGTPASNASRNIGRFAPTGVVSAGLGTVGPAAIGGMLGGPGGALLAGGTAAGVGTLGRVAATQMGMRNADIAELVARNGGALPQVNVMTPEMQQMIAAFAAGEGAKYLPKEKPRNPAPKR